MSVGDNDDVDDVVVVNVRHDNDDGFEMAPLLICCRSTINDYQRLRESGDVIHAT